MLGVKHWFCKGQIGIVSTIATMIGFWLIKNRAVMCRYNGVHITITYLNCVSFKSFVE